MDSDHERGPQMPMYELYCPRCRRVQEVLTTRASAPVDTTCAHCRKPGMRRLISRVRVVLSEQSRMDRLEDPAQWAGLEEEDPVALSRTLKRMQGAFGDVYGPGDVDQALEESMEAAAKASPTPSEDTD